MGAITGIHVLDLSRFIAGPLCAQLLGDMGAEVVKVERPGGEDARHHAPYVNGESLYVMQYNRNKHAITLDTRHPEALPILEELVRRSDVLVENYRPGTLEKMGLGYERLHELNPGLVVTSISGFGQYGPLAQRALFDAIAQAMSGMMGQTGDPEAKPTKVGGYIADYVAGIYSALGTMFALFHRERTGEGQIVDVASVDALFTCLDTGPSQYALFGKEPERTGSRDPLNSPANVFPARDGYIYLHGGTDPLFPRLCQAMGRSELADDARFQNSEGRMRHFAELEAVVEEWLSALTVDEAGALLGEAGVPFGPVQTIPEVVESDQIRAREMMVEVAHSVAGTVTLPGSPLKMSSTSAEITKAPPAVGEDNEEVYTRLLGLSRERLEELRAAGAV